MDHGELNVTADAAAVTGKQKTPEKSMLHSFTGAKIQDIPPLRRRGRTDMYGHPSVFPPLPMSCSCLDEADVSPDGLPDPGVNRGFFF